MNKRADELYLHEQMLLLVLRDREGTLESKAGMYRIALGGAILIELLLQGRITVDEDRKRLVNVVSTAPLGEEVLDEALAKIAAARRRRGAPAWINSLAGIRRLRHRVAAALCRRRILKDSQDTVLLIFKRKVYPTINPIPERQLLREIGSAIKGTSPAIDPRIVVLVALAHATGTLKAHFDRRTLKARSKRIEKIVSGDLAGDTAHAAAQAAVQAAVAAATVVATSAATR